MLPKSGSPSHSALGFISFAIALLYALCLLMLKLFKVYSLSPSEYTGFMLVGLIALGLGIAGLLHRQRDRLFPMLGIIISTACLLTSFADLWMQWLH